MGIIGQLTQTCDIYRVTTTFDSMGGPTESSSVIATGIPCRIQHRSSTLLSLIRGRDDVTEFIGFFKHGTDIVQGDKVLFDGDYLTVVSVDKNTGAVGHHMEVLLGR